jgi:hypothetical protein
MTRSRRSPRRSLALVWVSLMLIGVYLASSASGAMADETFWYGNLEPYVAKSSTGGLVDIIQGEGWSGESCIDLHTESGNYTEQTCHGKEVVEEQQPHNNGWARVWNAHASTQLEWGWARF